MALTEEDFIPLYNNLQQKINELSKNTGKAICKYCQGIGDEKELYSDANNYWFMLKSQTQNGRWYILHVQDNTDGVYGIQINNCPMCGRKLEKNER